ncbi:hypothetical protein GCM10017781_06340 [Deinococcus metalli]|uniref:Uncharacterized protein n=1 Tax=Deinococcus metalli TaxID=1141878 RepID=A0ABQ3JJ45_9DEIO|nr:hypothetical protein GCM10017781_06340 [Deinococcus metalli]
MAHKARRGPNAAHSVSEGDSPAKEEVASLFAARTLLAIRIQPMYPLKKWGKWCMYKEKPDPEG